jgi:hypothetical protein
VTTSPGGNLRAVLQMEKNWRQCPELVTAIDKLEKAKRGLRADAQGDHSGWVATAGTNEPSDALSGGRPKPQPKSLERVMLGQAEISLRARQVWPS